MTCGARAGAAGPAIALASLLAAGAQAQDLASARRFVAAIYAHYPVAEKKPVFDPLDGKVEGRYFDRPLIALIHEDRRLAGDEVPTLDGDVFCDCQEDDGMSFALQSVKAAGPDATAVVVRRGPDREKPETITLSLVMTPAGWRVHDIHTPSAPSLRGMLETGIQGWRKTKTGQ